jgi:hypothetical protein
VGYLGKFLLKLFGSGLGLELPMIFLDLLRMLNGSLPGRLLFWRGLLAFVCYY